MKTLNVRTMPTDLSRSLLFISDSDISVDSRILKAISVVPSSISIYAIGITQRVPTSSNFIHNVVDKRITPYSRRLTFLPNLIRHLFTLLEFYVRALLHIFSIKPSFIHCNDFIPLPLAFISKLLFRSKIIYDAHELESNRNGISFLTGKIIYLVERALWQHIDGFVTVSESIRSWYLNQFGVKQSIVILNSPSFQKLPQSSSYLRKHFDIPADCLIFIYVGYLMPGRSLEAIARIFASGSTHHHLVFLGTGSLQDSLQAISVNSTQIHFHPFVSHTEVVPILGSADVGLCFIENVSLSDYYSLPNKLFEYCFAGLKILACDFPEISKFVTTNSLGSITSSDFDSLTRSILNFSISSSTSKDMTSFSWPIQAKMLYNFYNTVFFE